MKYKNTLLLCFFIGGFFSCKKERKFQSYDLTKENIFTEGIEGPATDSLGNIYAVNFQKGGTVGKVTPDGDSSLFIELPDGSIGNGIRFGKHNQMFIADYTNHNVLEVNLSTREIQIFANQPLANQPNDIAVLSKSILYASDPNWEDGTGNLWKVTKDNGFELLEKDMGTTNGVEVSPDGKSLYVNESFQRKVWVYDIQKNGHVTNKRELISFNDFGLDGMRCDKEGNLYVCRYDKGTVVVVSPEGKVLNEILLKGKKPTNITFDVDFSKCYVTVADRGCIEVVDLF